MSKKFLLLTVLLPFFTMAQYTTGTIALGTEITVKFDTSSTTVTMTLTGPINKWFAVGINATGMTGTNAGKDCALYSTSLVDRNFTGSTSEPNIDASQDWTVTSNTDSGSIKTIVATRLLNTGDVKDHVFVNGPGSLPLVWAVGNTTTVQYHASRGGGGGTIQANFVLGADSFEKVGFKMYPNPTNSKVNITLPNGITTAFVYIFDMQGRKVLNVDLTSTTSVLDVSRLEKGHYIVKIFTDSLDASQSLLIE